MKNTKHLTIILLSLFIISCSKNELEVTQKNEKYKIENKYAYTDNQPPSMGEVTEIVKRIIKENSDAQEDIVLQHDLVNDLACDELNIMEIIMEIEEEFDIEFVDGDSDRLYTVLDYINYVLFKLQPPSGGGGGGGGVIGDDPDLIPTATVTNVPASSISRLRMDTEGAWGLTWDESIDLEIGATLFNGAWRAVLITANGNYSLQARLIGGVSEVGGTSPSNFCAQVRDLKALGNVNGVQWYMISAVSAHENVHASRTLPSLTSVLSNIANDVKALIIPNTGQTKSQAITTLRNLADFQIIVNNAKSRWRTAYWNTVPADHAANGPCDLAERAIVAPVGIGICNIASTQAWASCTYCPF